MVEEKEIFIEERLTMAMRIIMIMDIQSPPPSWVTRMIPLYYNGLDGRNGQITPLNPSMLNSSISKFHNYFWCLGPDLNRHGSHPPRDFKSLASTNSATQALFSR